MLELLAVKVTITGSVDASSYELLAGKDSTIAGSGCS